MMPGSQFARHSTAHSSNSLIVIPFQFMCVVWFMFLFVVFCFFVAVVNSRARAIAICDVRSGVPCTHIKIEIEVARFASNDV